MKAVKATKQNEDRTFEITDFFLYLAETWMQPSCQSQRGKKREIQTKWHALDILIWDFKLKTGLDFDHGDFQSLFSFVIWSNWDIFWSKSFEKYRLFFMVISSIYLFPPSFETTHIFFIKNGNFIWSKILFSRWNRLAEMRHPIPLEQDNSSKTKKPKCLDLLDFYDSICILTTLMGDGENCLKFKFRAPHSCNRSISKPKRLEFSPRRALKLMSRPGDPLRTFSQIFFIEIPKKDIHK